jgi:hypothetical protein
MHQLLRRLFFCSDPCQSTSVFNGRLNLIEWLFVSGPSIDCLRLNQRRKISLFDSRGKIIGLYQSVIQSTIQSINHDCLCCLRKVTNLMVPISLAQTNSDSKLDNHIWHSKNCTWLCHYFFFINLYTSEEIGHTNFQFVLQRYNCINLFRLVVGVHNEVISFTASSKIGDAVKRKYIAI